MRRFTLISMILILCFSGGKTIFGQEKTSITKVVIDAGHGGKDPGTIGKKSQEKNVALQIALKLGEEIRSKCKGVTVICTRTTDEFIELHERAEIANRSKADLFISIHCNANPKHTFLGAETYVMGLHRTEANLEIAKKENASILMEPDYSTNYNGFDPNSDESYITFTLFQNAFLDQSTRFASLVQDEMKDRVGMNDRGVRQAGFLVLYKTTMPSVLIETGFLSNPDEEKYLMSEKGQQYIAEAICKAFSRFRDKVEGTARSQEIASDRKVRKDEVSIKQTVISRTNPEMIRKTDSLAEAQKPENSKPKTQRSAVTEAPGRSGKEAPPKSDTNVRSKQQPATHSEVVNSTKEKVKTASSVRTPGPKSLKTTEKKESDSVSESQNITAHKKNIETKEFKSSAGVVKKNSEQHDQNVDSRKIKTGQKDLKAPESLVTKDSTNHSQQIAARNKKKGVKSNESDKLDGKPTPNKMSSDEPVFRVQFATSPKELSVHSKKFVGLRGVWRYYHQGLYKYTVGKESNPDALSELLAQIRGKGFADAFIVAFMGTERISVADGRKMMQKK